MTNDLRSRYPTIGVLAGWQYYWTATPRSYLDPIFRGIRAAARKLQCNLLLGCGMGLAANANVPVRPAWPVLMDGADFVPIGPWNTDGLIIVNPLHAEARSHYIQELRAAGHPLIFVGSGEFGATIVADNTGGTGEAFRHLVEHGHRSIAFIAGNPQDMAGDTGARLHAYRAEVSSYGLIPDERLIAFGNHVVEGGHTAMRQILDRGAPFTAVLASNDESAHGAIRALQEAGRRIPEDVAIIGFDDRLESSVLKPALTTVQIPLFRMGYQAVEHLLQQQAGNESAAQQIKVPTRLMIRESCGCPQCAVRPEPDSAGALYVASPGKGSVGEPVAADPAQGQLVQRMTFAMLAETQSFGIDELEFLCRSLVESFVRSLRQQRSADFQEALTPILNRMARNGDDAHLWQAGISMLRRALPGLLEHAPEPASHDLGYALIDEARLLISAAMRQQHHQYIVDQRWTSNYVGRLTAQLLTTLDQAQIYESLSHYLREMDIHTAWIALFEADDSDPVAWIRIRDVISPDQPLIRSHSREFPPPAWIVPDRPFSLALLPLVGQQSGTGFAAFDMIHLDLLGPIVQQMSAALNTAHLYQQATEGRRLAEEANQIKSRFLSTVSHELRTPLNLIVGMSGLLLQESKEFELKLPDSIQNGIKCIQTNARHLGRLIDDVLDLASSDAGQLRLSFEFIDLREAMQIVAETGRQMAAEKGLIWRASLPNTSPWVWGDRTRLHQVALNLISNAIKFTTQGEVSLSVEVVRDRVLVRVGDTGLGLPAADQQAIFDEFQRSERTILRGYGGIGLGLAICKRLVEMHNGVIGVESSGVEGAGSEFYFSLPMIPAPTLPAPSLSTTRSAHSLRQILLLSSHGNERLRGHLAQRDFDLAIVPIEQSARWLSLLMTEPVSGVLLDISQGSPNGWQALKLLKSSPATRHIPAFFYAAEADIDIVLELDYLTKPVEVAELTRALHQYWPPTDNSLAGRTYLVVDDDPPTLDLHTRIIQSQAGPNRVLGAPNGRVALEILNQTPVDLVLLDLMMPEVDGFAVLEAMRKNEQTCTIPVIVVTGQVLTEDEMTRLNGGVATVLRKGLFGVDETLAHLDSALERRHNLSSEAQRLVRKAMAYLHEHYPEAITRKELARYVGMNDDYLTYCFRQETGLTPITYLNRYRVNQARQLLAETNKSITDIALEVGFSNSGYFSRVFRREIGISPDAYRRQ
jgi:signal transduction histidine kinase/AraC-like DNA-binding protein/ABC-type sugar transport system substrate-binding protein